MFTVQYTPELQSAKSRETTSNDAIKLQNVLDGTSDGSKVSTKQPHSDLVQHFKSDVSIRNKFSRIWNSSIAVGVGHALQGVFGVAAFRAAYVKASGQSREDRAGPMLVQYKPGLKDPGLSAEERTRGQANIASWSEVGGAVFTFPLSILLGIFGGLSGLCARALRGNEQPRTQNTERDSAAVSESTGQIRKLRWTVRSGSSAHEVTFVSSDTDLMNKLAMGAEAERKRQAWSTDCHEFVDSVAAEIAARAVDAQGTSSQTDSSKTATNETQEREITDIRNAFTGVADCIDRQSIVRKYSKLASEWTDNKHSRIIDDNDERQVDLLNQMADQIEKMAVYEHLQSVYNVVDDRRHESDSQQRPLPAQSLSMKAEDFRQSCQKLVDEAFPAFVRAELNESILAAASVHHRILKNMESRPPHSLYKIMTTIR